MISVTGGTRLFLFRGPADMRRGFDGLSGMVEAHFSESLFSGALFIFLNRRKNRVKILYWDHGGLALWYKKLERGRFVIPSDKEGEAVELTSAELSMLLEGITPLRVSRRYRLGDGLREVGTQGG
jgi:transposase